MKELLHPYLRFVLIIVGVVILSWEASTYYYPRLLAPHNRQSVAGTPLVPPDKTVAPPSLDLQPKTVTISDFSLIKTIDKARIDAAQLSFTTQLQPTSVEQIQIYKLRYNITSGDGSFQPVTATVYVPSLTASDPSVTYPLYVFGSGTTGMADKCAPSLEDMAVENLGNYENHMIAQASSGFVSVFPDYEGFHSDERTQAYFIVESEAQVLLGAIRSLKQLASQQQALSVIDFSNVFLGGYSQGGHAALSTAQQWHSLPKDIELKGVIQYAGAADVLALFKESPWLASYLAASYSEYYEPSLETSVVLQEKWLAELEHNNKNLCVNQAYKYYPKAPAEIYTTTFLDALESPTWPSALTAWQEAITVNTPLHDLPDVPYLSIQGAVDPIVTAKTQRQNTQRLCDQGKTIFYREYPGVNHFQIRQESLSFSTQWMKDIMSGSPAATNCTP